MVAEFPTILPFRREAPQELVILTMNLRRYACVPRDWQAEVATDQWG